MRARNIITLFAVLLLTSLGMQAQGNTLSIPDMKTAAGRESTLQINLDNTTDVVAVQFNISVPESLSLYGEATTDRTPSHSVSGVEKYDSETGRKVYTYILISPDNSVISGRTGAILNITMRANDDLTEGTVLQPAFSDVTIATRDGSNVATGYSTGTITIAPSPDLIVTDIHSDALEITPGENIVVNWTVENIGSVPTSGGWSEEISLIGEDESWPTYLATTYHDGILDAGGIVSRQAELTVPFLLGLHGNSRIQIRIVPHYETGESLVCQDNNTATGTFTLFTNKILNVGVYPNKVVENENSSIYLQVERSGSWMNEETFEIKTSKDNRIDLPSSIIIPASHSGSTLYFKVKDNDIFDNDSIVTITVNGNGYTESSALLNIEDDERTILTINVSKDDILEGETFQMTVASSIKSPSPTVVNLICEKPHRFDFPSRVTIPANEDHVAFDVTAVDNEDIERDETIAFIASADKFDSGECLITIFDNDMPTLEFTLAPESVSESDGYAALMGTIKRTDNIDKRVTLKLSDDSDGRLSYSTKNIVLEKNQTTAQFSIGVVDNDIVNGDHEVSVTATVYSASCGCSVGDESKGSLTKTITVIDDDGPSLKIKPEGTLMLEGSEGNSFIISHNVVSDQDVQVKISSDREELLKYDHAVTIPAGKTSTTLLVDVKGNDTPDDSGIATFKVEADGFAIGTCWLMITDQTLPDAIVTLSSDKTEAEAEQTVELKAVVKNTGNRSLRSGLPIQISFSGSKDRIRLSTDRTIEVGDSAVLEYSYKLPAITGVYSFEATVNPDKNIEELLYVNNISNEVAISILPPFTATAHADKDIYRQGEEITISGKAGKKADVEVYIINEGTRQKVDAVSDEEGNYSVAWQPFSSQSGHFTVGACYPGSMATDETDSFDIYGFKTTDRFKTHEFCQYETVNGQIEIINPGNLAQTGITITPKLIPYNCEFTYDAPHSIDAGKSITLAYSIKGNDLSKGLDWQQIPLEISSAEGSKIDFTVYFFVNSLKARLETNDNSINTTMTMGNPREYPVTIRNVGKTETGKITLALPEWIQTSTPREMVSLEQGDSATIVLRFMPTETMKLNVAKSGQIGINCENGDGLGITYSITPVSDDKGSVKFDVVDEYTYFTAEAPHVYNATVKIKNPSTGAVVAEGITSSDGTFTTILPEGYYSVEIEADKHDSYQNTLIVDPGVEKEKEVFLTYQAISYSWEVVETEVEDEYEIETTVKYETRVPKAVVVITLPEKKPEMYSIIPVILTNHGLINALDVRLSLSVSNGYALEFLNEPNIDVLGPQQDYIVYAKLVPSDKDDKEPEAKKVSGDASPCFSLGGEESHKNDCEKNPNRESSDAERSWGNCYGDGSGWGGIGIGSGWGGIRGGNSSESTPSSSPLRGGRKNKVGPSDNSDNVSEPVKDCSSNDNTPKEKPIKHKIVPDGPVKHTDCDQEPKLVYKLVPSTGTRYEMLGVAADGVSQVKIVLDPTQSLIPSSNCVNYDIIGWHLSKEGFGSIKSISEWEAIYTAPQELNERHGSTFSVEATLYYNRNGRVEKSDPVTIQIVRPPIVFIHGLGDSDYCWEQADRHLVWSNLYPEDYNVRVNYDLTNTSMFTINVPKVKQGVNDAQNQALKLGYVATKCDLIGHSMGGILARLFVEQAGKADLVNRIITVNTPHAGSELGDLVTAHPVIWGTLSRLYYKKFDIDAISNLGVESEETASLLHPKSDIHIPVYALGTLNNQRDQILLNSALLLEYVNMVLLTADALSCGLSIVPATIVSVVLNELQHAILDDYSQIGPGDLVVSTESQIGGCEANHIIEGAWHVDSPRDKQIIKEIKELVTLPYSDPTFSKNWFHPKKRDFKHSESWEWANRSISIIPVVGTVWSALSSQWFILNHIQHDDTTPSTRGAASSSERVISLDMNIPEGLEFVLATVKLNDNLAYVLHDDEMNYVVPSTFSGDINVTVFLRDQKHDVFYDEKTITIEKPIMKPVRLDARNIIMTKGSISRLALICTWEDGSETYVYPDYLEFERTGIAGYYDGHIKGLSVGTSEVTINYAGLDCKASISVFPPDKDDTDGSNTVCNSITLAFKQKTVMTRQAFRGTLTVNNGNESTPMKDFRLNLEVRDPNGKLASSREFQINAESLEGFKGDTDLASSWSLGGGETGIAKVLFIPTKYAAPSEPTEYSFGGSFSYTDPYTGVTVTRALNPVTLTVKPSPVLNMTYFMQRDVIGDDPLTEAVEPSEEAEFSLLIHNIGNGEATDLRLMTEQPKIAENSKGLLIDFEMISSQLNGGDKNLALGSSVATAIGDIKPQETAYAQWWFKSSLLGHFYEYNVNVSHVTSYDNPDLSLINDVTIHELIRSLEGEKEGKKLAAFMTNDIADDNDTPDRMYLSDGSIENVHTAMETSFKKVSDDVYVLSLTPSSQGWNYGNVIDPTYGVSRIMSVVRKSDGKEMSLRNFWQTDRTLRDGKDPLYENRIHFADHILSDAPVEYELTFSPAPTLTLEVAAIEGTPIDDSPAINPIEAVNVMFNKHIDPTTFTPESITMSSQGSRIDTDGIVISTDDNKTFHLDLTSVDQSMPGFYTLTVTTVRILDTEGFSGKNGKSVGWSYYPDGNVTIGIEVYPENSGHIVRLNDGSETIVNPADPIKASYGENITLTAIPEEGYEFFEWTNMDDTYSEKEKIEFNAVSNGKFTAEFSPKSYSVEVDAFCSGGSILGTSSGYYYFGDELALIAVAEEGFAFRHWIVNGEAISEDSAMTYKVKGQTKITALFIEGSGVDLIGSKKKVIIHSIDGLLIDRDATLETIQKLEKGIYIINGVKCLIQ